jgi:hypothetical protein
LVRVDGSVNPGITESKLIRGRIAHVLVEVGDARAYTLNSPLGDIMAGAVGNGTAVLFEEINLSRTGTWKVLNPDLTTKTSFDVTQFTNVTNLKILGLSEVASSTKGQFDTEIANPPTCPSAVSCAPRAYMTALEYDANTSPYCLQGSPGTTNAYTAMGLNAKVISPFTGNYSILPMPYQDHQILMLATGGDYDPPHVVTIPTATLKPSNYGDDPPPAALQLTALAVAFVDDGFADNVTAEGELRNINPNPGEEDYNCRVPSSSDYPVSN